MKVSFIEICDQVKLKVVEASLDKINIIIKSENIKVSDVWYCIEKYNFNIDDDEVYVFLQKVTNG